jgi:methionine-rich copper-binding protein CopC
MRCGSYFRTAYVAAALSLGIAGQAFAHARLISAVPAENGEVSTAPAVLQLKFSEGIDLKFSGVAIAGPHKKPVPTGESSLATGDDRTLIVPISGILTSGEYTVTWRALSADGHKTHGAFVFTVKP